jgi:hypothetical protein
MEDFNAVEQHKEKLPFYFMFTKDHDDNSDLLVDEIERTMKKLHGFLRAYNLNCDQYYDQVWPNEGYMQMCN